MPALRVQTTDAQRRPSEKARTSSALAVHLLPARPASAPPIALNTTYPPATHPRRDHGVQSRLFTRRYRRAHTREQGRAHHNLIALALARRIRPLAAYARLRTRGMALFPPAAPTSGTSRSHPTACGRPCSSSPPLASARPPRCRRENSPTEPAPRSSPAVRPSPTMPQAACPHRKNAAPHRSAPPNHVLTDKTLHSRERPPNYSRCPKDKAAVSCLRQARLAE